MNGVYIEITDACNLNCSFCPCGKIPNLPKTFMGESLFERSIAEAKTVSENVYFHILGEPTLHPKFDLFLEKLLQYNLKLNLTTNGTTISRKGNSILKSEAIRQVNFSTHAYSELNFEKAKSYLNDVLDFCVLANKIRPDIYINLRLWNVGDKNSLEWNRYVIDEINNRFNAENYFTENTPKISVENFCSRHKSFNILNRLYIHQDSRFEWPKLKENTSEIIKGTCRALDTHVGILHNGNVVACCLDYEGKITLGNIAENSLKNILESPLAKFIADGFLKKELRHPLCKNCEFCKRFKK